MTLYSYVIPVDDGAAPNPFWGACTLVICKPRIRAVAREGDWVVATGSKNAPGGDLSGKAVYAMRVSRTMPMREYDAFAARELPGKVPDLRSPDWRRKVGDSIYDFSGPRVRTRPGRHTAAFKALDLGGKNALVSYKFSYLGSSPVELPRHLRLIVKTGNGHRGPSNAWFEDAFAEWFQDLPRGLVGEPQIFPWGR